MNVWHMIFREILYRKGNFLLAVLSVVVAVGCVVAILSILRFHDLTTKAIVAQKEKETEIHLKEEREKTDKRVKQAEAMTKARLVQFDTATKTHLKKARLDTQKQLKQFQKETEEYLEGVKTKTEELLANFEKKTKDHIAEVEKKTKERVAKLEDDYRKITKGLGFNILILPKSQNLIEMHAQGYATEIMPESYAEKLAGSKIMVINHLLPLVQGMVKWPEKERRVLLTGIRGEVPLMHGNQKKPLIQPVPKGTLVVGYELHRNLKLKVGDKVKFHGKEFTVHKLHEERGTRDDITIWMNLEEAQELLEYKGKINAILALECNCATVDRLGEIRQEIKKILPDTQVLEMQSKALARAEARNRAKKEAEDALKQEKEEAKKLLAQKKLEAEETIAQEKLNAEKLLAQKKAEELATLDQEEKNTKTILAQKQAEEKQTLEDEKQQAEDALVQETTRAETSLKREKEARIALQDQYETFAAILTPLALLGSIVWLGVMSLGNVRERQSEIGILRALGLPSSRVFTLFISRFVIIGVLGAILGYLLGTSVGLFWADAKLASSADSVQFGLTLLGAALLSAPLLCALVGWIAARVAVQHDPATILQDN